MQLGSTSSPTSWLICTLCTVPLGANVMSAEPDRPLFEQFLTRAIANLRAVLAPSRSNSFPSTEPEPAAPAALVRPLLLIYAASLRRPPWPSQFANCCEKTQTRCWEPLPAVRVKALRVAPVVSPRKWARHRP